MRSVVEQAIESEAGAKVAQALAVAVQVTEAVVRLRSQNAASREANARQLEGAAKAQRTATMPPTGSPGRGPPNRGGCRTPR